MKNKKYFFLALAIIVVCYIASFIISYVSLEAVIRDNSHQITKVLAEKIHDAINNELTKPISVSRAMAKDKFLIERLRDEDKYDLQRNIDDFASYLDYIHKGLGYESTFLVSEHSRYYYSHQGLNKKVDVINDSHDIWYRVFLDHHKEYELNVDEDQTKQDTLTIFVNTRLEDFDGKLLGVCGMGVQMLNLLNLVRQSEERYHVNIDMVDGTGLVLVDTDMNNIGNRILLDIPEKQRQNNEYVYKLEGESFIGTRYIENLSWYLIIRNDEDYSSNAYTRLLISYLIFLAILVVLMLGAIYAVLKRERTLYMSSSTDVLTGLKSRTLYEYYIGQLRDKGHKNVTIVSLDLNGLKRANDSIGHLAGDELIKAAGHFIRNYFHHKGQSYRIGGDEFAVIIDHCNIDKEQMYNEFKELIARWHGNLVDTMSISMGIACGCEHDFEDISKLIEIADIEMYKDKTAYYREHPKTR